MIYEWRRLESAPILGVLGVREMEGGKISIKNTNLQGNSQNMVIAESILYRINT